MPKGLWRGAQGPLVHGLPLEESLPALPGLNPRGAGGRGGGGGRRAGASPGVSYVLKAEIFCDTLSTFLLEVLLLVRHSVDEVPVGGGEHVRAAIISFWNLKRWSLGLSQASHGVLWIVGWITRSRFNFSFSSV